MAIYDYKCKNDHKYSEMRSIKEEQRITECPECGDLLKQVYHVPLMQLKGGGYYKGTR